MNVFVAFGILSIPILMISWRSIVVPGSHGFFRFMGWECILWLSLNNVKVWFRDPFSIPQIVSWIFLFISAYMVIYGVVMIKGKGKPGKRSGGQGLYRFEKTTELIDTGIYRYIRHPLYSSLLFLTWGILLKNITISLTTVAILSSMFLYLTARSDEKECIQYFGENYTEYMNRTRMFIPWIF